MDITTNELTTKISLDLIDDPYIAMRSNLDDEQMDELKASMREHGLIEPVVLRKLGDRYEIIAGHRRSRAARLLGWATIEAKIMQADDRTALSLRLAENSDRADVNPVDEAVFIGDIMLKHNLTPQQIAEMMKRSISWIENRLAIFEMPDYMQDHVRTGRYSVGAALWIAKIRKEDTRKYYAHFAALNGVSIAGAQKWYLDLEAENFELNATTEQVSDGNISAPKFVTYVNCERCGEKEDIMKLRNVFVHSQGECVDEKTGS